ncbi:MAG: 50S ribosome-binding GTPase [Candidatus Staskawiczbacteria bacterium]|nr:50S ribosome-binding GTPase [Candidatus Staskawiczbacteria bacterium]
MADIPGLIEGAFEGKGLGIKFLRHIERTKVLFHLISADSADPLGDYQTIRDELAKYNKLLLEKVEYIFLSKSDTVLPEAVSKIIADFKRFKKEIIPISIIDSGSILRVKEILNELILNKTA